MNLSYWEIKSWFSEIDFCIIGSGIVGLHMSLFLKEKYPQSKILILEKGNLPEGASTKNAGFACFGSLSELVDDLENHSDIEVQALVKKRWEGLKLLRQLGDKQIGYEEYGGYELFLEKDKRVYYEDQMRSINSLLNPIFNAAVFKSIENPFGFKNVDQTLVFNPLEAQIDTGKMMQSLLAKVVKAGVLIVNNCTVSGLEDHGAKVEIFNNIHDFSAEKVLIATNGFAAQLIAQDIKPARAQVLITKPIKDLAIKGTFHLDKGYYYFRNIDDRILLGGGRNLDFQAEETTEFGQTDLVQQKLEQILSDVILPNQNFEIEHRWSGIMGVGIHKKPIVESLSNNVFCGVRLGGMGIAIGAQVAKEIVDLV